MTWQVACSSSSDSLDQWRVEIRTLASLAHPNIVRRLGSHGARNSRTVHALSTARVHSSLTPWRVRTVWGTVRQVRYLGYVAQPPNYCLVLEFCEGGDLHDALRRGPTPKSVASDPQTQTRLSCRLSCRLCRKRPTNSDAAVLPPLSQATAAQTSVLPPLSQAAAQLRRLSCHL
jgi:serine/threonine protein kinase